MKIGKSKYIKTRILVAPKVPSHSRYDTGSLATFVATENLFLQPFLGYREAVFAL